MQSLASLLKTLGLTVNHGKCVSSFSVTCGRGSSHLSVHSLMVHPPAKNGIAPAAQTSTIHHSQSFSDQKDKACTR